jgi:hypothetical protein
VKNGRYVKAKYAAKKTMRFVVRHRPVDDTDGCVGQCWPFGKGTHELEIDPRQCPKDYLDTVIHEASHCLFPKKKEKAILRAATSIANLLWRLGYRRVKPQRKVVP